MAQAAQLGFVMSCRYTNDGIKIAPGLCQPVSDLVLFYILVLHSE